MERFIGLFIFFIIFAVGKYLESVQKQKGQAQRKQQTDRNRQTRDVAPRTQTRVEGQTTVPREPSMTRPGYQASESEVEEFLRSVGLKAPKPLPPEKTVSEDVVRSQPKPAVAPTKKKSPQGKGFTNVHDDRSVTNIHDIPTVDKHLKYASLLTNSEQIRQAFVMSEIFGQPRAMRRIGSKQ